MERSWIDELRSAVDDFREVARLGGEPLPIALPAIEILPAPHKPPARLPQGVMAIYTFWGDGCWLKIGKVGAKSGPRFTSQHYNPGSANSNLAKSVFSCPSISAHPAFRAEAPGDWIKQHCHRANLLLPSTHSQELLSCLEAFLHLRLKPRFER